MRCVRRLVLIKVMPQLKWNEYDFIECLGVLPQTDEYFCSHSFVVIKDNLKLELTLWQYESLVAISLSQGNRQDAFLTLYFIVRENIKFLNEKNSSVLKFCDCIFVENRFWLSSEDNKIDYFDESKIPTKTNLLLSIYPKLEFKIK